MILQASNKRKMDFEITQPKKISDKKNELTHQKQTLTKFLRNGWEIKCVSALIQRTELELTILVKDLEKPITKYPRGNA